MAIDKIKKILFTLICIVLVASAGVIAYAAWDDVTGKKTNDLTTTTGTNTTLSATSEGYANNTKFLVPYNTDNFTDDATKNNPTHYLSWKITPTLSDITKIDPTTNTVIQILYDKLSIVVKDSTGTTKLSNDTPENTEKLNAIFTYGLSETAPVATAGSSIVTVGTFIGPGTTVDSVLASGTPYYFTIKFAKPIAAENVAFSGCTIDIAIDLKANGLPTA